jgi:hypothetical protein
MYAIYMYILVLVWPFLSHTVAAPSASNKSWWEGMSMDREDAPKADDMGTETKAAAITEGPLMQIPCGVIRANDDKNVVSNVHPLETILDTSLATSTLSWQAVKAKGLSGLVVKDDQGRTYIIPAGALWLRMGSLEATVAAPAILVIHEQQIHPIPISNFEFRLGMDFLRSNQAVIDLQEEVMNILIEEEIVVIPFLRTRTPLSFGEDL